jgi:hypothetical protein
MPPDNVFYAQAAYVAASAVYVAYAVSVWRRRRQLERRRRAASGGSPGAAGRAGAPR